MTINRTTTIFFDAASLFAASHSPSGGSAYLILVCQYGYLHAIVSPDVLQETERNLLQKSTPAAFLRFRQLIADTPLRLISSPAEPLVRLYAPAFFEDGHVVAAALSSNAEYLITLDQPFARRMQAASLPIVTLSPGEFLQAVLPTHSEYERIRRTVT